MGLYSIIPCAEEAGTQSETHDRMSGVTTAVTLRCAWADRHDLATDLLDNHREWPHGVYAEPPQAKTVAIRPGTGSQFIASGQSCEYEDALVTVNYSSEIRDLISESLEPTVEFITQDYKRFRWGSADGDALLEAEAPGKLVRGLSLVRTMYQVPTPLPTALIDLPGFSNDADYTSALLGLTFKKECLLLVPAQITRTIKSDGSATATVGLKFMYKKDTWNKFWRAKSGAYEEIFDIESGTAHKNNPPANFAALLY